jgi:hypothetical protein
MKPKVIRISTVPLSLHLLLQGQLKMLAETYEVLAVSSSGEELHKVAEREGVRTCAIPMERHIAPLKDLIALIRLIILFHKEKPQIVHSLTPKAGLLAKIKTWSKSSHVYTCRFGIETLMSHYLDKDFKAEYLEIPASVRSEEYYVKMMIAWFFATALAKQWDATIPYIEQRRLAPWTHNKTIQKAIESYRITPEQKEYLRTLKIK